MSVIDWSTRPPPWNLIGPAFRAECENIASGVAPPVGAYSAIERRQVRPSPSGTQAERGREIRIRRHALGINGHALGRAAGYSAASASVMVSGGEWGKLGDRSMQRIESALDLLEAERGSRAA